MKHTQTFENFVNESDEVSVDSIMTPAQKKALKNAFENSVMGVDSVSFKRNGTIIAKRAYFYRHGNSPDKVAERLQSDLKKEGIEIEIVETYDDWKAWPKTSYFVVVFKLK